MSDKLIGALIVACGLMIPLGIFLALYFDDATWLLLCLVSAIIFMAG